jgi:hypothetical protein
MCWQKKKKKKKKKEQPCSNMSAYMLLIGAKGCDMAAGLL